ncbi:MAG: hypothetical protein WCB67_03150, partial [Solirubrobacteraceae bacterium]
MATALVLAITALTPAPASAFSKAIWGSAYHQGVNQFPMYKRLGVGIVEADLDWSQIAPARPRQATNPRDRAYRWPATIQRIVAQARRFHMQVLLQLIFTPPWANGGGVANVPPLNPRDYAAFAKAAARKYPSVHLWMIWGEPDRAPNFSLTQTVVPG